MKITNYAIKTKNETLCLEKIINNNGVSRAELATVTGLTKAAVSTIVKKLLDDQLVVETGLGEASILGGRKPIQLKYNENAGLSVSIDIGYNYINALLTYLNGNEIAYKAMKVEKIDETTLEDTLKKILEYFNQIKPKTTFDIIGIVIGIHGPIFENNIVFTPQYNLDKLDFLKIMENITDYPIFLENEANLSALGEYSFTHQTSLISISMNSGIGAGVVSHGILQKGAHGLAGEIGHQIIELDGRKCRCGNCGCLDMYAATKVVCETFAKYKKIDFVNTIILKEFYNNGDVDAINAVEENTKYLSLGINNAIAHYDPEVIILNSSLYREIPEMITMLENNLGNKLSKKTTIRNSDLNEKATLLGGFVFNVQRFLNIKNMKFIG